MATIKSLANRKNWNKVKRLIKQGQFKDAIRGTMRKLRSSEEQVLRSVPYRAMIEQNKRREGEVLTRLPQDPVDIVVPVYNGLSYLQRLLPGIERTKIPYRIILVDDASPDPEVKEFLDAYTKEHEEARLIRNERNLGFVASVNRGLVMTRHHVVLINTDVELPSGWLERLIKPIVMDGTIASATPFTNSGTIASFPEYLKDNHLFNSLSVDEIDAAFAGIRCQYTPIPTGVGFCMAMNQRVIKQIGIFDQQAFGRGYGEENDWCLRAQEAGFRNVIVENLYVFHNHGGTFLPQEKQRLMEENREILLQRHPQYSEQVGAFNEKDPLCSARAYAFLKLTSNLSKNKTFLFHNTLGGGADSYRRKFIAQKLEKGEVVITVRYIRPTKSYQADYQWRDHVERLELLNLDEVFDLADRLDISAMVLNQIVTYPKPDELLQRIHDYVEEKGLSLTVMVHDYYCICPTIYLLSEQHRYCELPNVEECEHCLLRNASRDNYDVPTMEAWRQNWRRVLSCAQEVRVFSEDSARMLRKAYGDGDIAINVLEEQHTDMIPVVRREKRTSTVNIGIFGTLTELKGAQLIREMVKTADDEKLEVRIILCGRAEDKIRSSRFKETGPYHPEELPALVLEEDIDIVFISSLCPETYSFTTQEAMELGLPVACLPLGAPRERIALYEKGLIVENKGALPLLQELIRHAKQFMPPYSTKTDKALLVYETESYATRYRCDHLKEQLAGYGITAEEKSMEEGRINIDGYRWIVLYRCGWNRRVRKLVETANQSGCGIWYSTDDFVFDYDAIKELPFLKRPEYEGFEDSCKARTESIVHTDGVIVSTESLATQVRREFPGKIVHVQRNAASYEMRALSKKALERPKQDKCRIILGYFSGSSTHDADFMFIAPALLKVLQEHPEVDIRIVGVLTIPKELRGFENRIQTIPFRPWQELPEIYRDIDINLMPVQDTVFHECKSENKWLEAALVQVPTVASYNRELEKVISHKEDGFLCRSQEEWADALEELILSKERRDEVGMAALKKVNACHTTEELEMGVRSIFS